MQLSRFLDCPKLRFLATPHYPKSNLYIYQQQIASGKNAHPRELEHILENLDCTLEDAVIKTPTNIIWGYGMMQYISEHCLKAELRWTIT